MIITTCNICKDVFDYDNIAQAKKCGFNVEYSYCSTCNKLEMRKLIKETVKDAAIDFMVHDRKEDKELSRDALDNALRSGIMSVDEVVKYFRETIECMLQD